MEPVMLSDAPDGERDLRVRLEERLRALQAEHAKGEEVVHSLDLQRQTTAETLLRIQGAIQVLQEELTFGQPPLVLSD